MDGECEGHGHYFCHCVGVDDETVEARAIVKHLWAMSDAVICVLSCEKYRPGMVPILSFATMVRLEFEIWNLMCYEMVL